MAAIGYNANSIAKIGRIQDGKSNAIVGNQTHDGELGDAVFEQPRTQRGSPTATIIKKRAITVDRWVLASSERLTYRTLVQQWMQDNTFAALYVVIGSERLCQAIKSSLAVELDLMLAGKTTMIHRVPAQTGSDRVAAYGTPADQVAGDIDCAVTLWDREGTTGTEIISQIDQR